MMKAAVYYGPGQVSIEEVPEPKPGPGELLLKVATTAICGTDAKEYVHPPMFMPIQKRHPHSGHGGPTIPGHEFSGWVAAVGGDVDGFVPGDLVTVGAGVSCGTCEPCRSGATHRCLTYWTVGLNANGGLAEMVAVPASCTLNLAGSNLSPDLAALCQPMSIAAHATRRGRITDIDRVVVIGTGGIGTFITYAAAKTGARVTAIDIDADKLAIARRLGATQTLDATEADPYAELRRVEPPTAVFECTALPDSLRHAVSTVAEGGRVIVVGHQSEPVVFDFKQVSLGERQLIGTNAHTFAVDFPRAADLIALDIAAWLDVAPYVFPLDEVVETGLKPMSTGNSSQVKVLFDPWIDSPRPLNIGTA